MKKIHNFNFKIVELNLDKYALPPDDPLGELSDFELGLRRFCYEGDRRVVVEIGEIQLAVFFDPDICILLEDRFPEQIGELAQGKSIRIDFVESHHLTAILTPGGKQIYCQLKDFDNFHFYEYELEQHQVMAELRRFLVEVMELAVDGGYVTLEEKSRFIAPAFPEKVTELTQPLHI